jgi:hypothetical protein
MENREIWHEVLVNTSPQILYRAVSEVGNLAHWWTTGVRGSSKVGDQLEFWFGDFCASVVEVQQLRVNELVQWLVTEHGHVDRDPVEYPSSRLYRHRVFAAWRLPHFWNTDAGYL